jgi:hypothetical protein
VFSAQTNFGARTRCQSDARVGDTPSRGRGGLDAGAGKLRAVVVGLGYCRADLQTAVRETALLGAKRHWLRRLLRESARSSADDVEVTLRRIYEWRPCRSQSLRQRHCATASTYTKE